LFQVVLSQSRKGAKFDEQVIHHSLRHCAFASASPHAAIPPGMRGATTAVKKK
jgi:hypothetical protein